MPSINEQKVLDPNVVMDINVLKEILGRHGLPTYGTKQQMVDRWYKSKTSTKDPSIALLHTVCSFYGLPQRKMKNQLIETLVEVSGLWFI